MIAYSYDKNFIFNGTVKCQKNPFREGCYLIPAMTTDIKPSKSAGELECLKFDIEQKKWIVIENVKEVERLKKEKLSIRNIHGVSIYKLENNKPVEKSKAEIENERQELLKKQIREIRKELFSEFNILALNSMLHDVGAKAKEQLREYQFKLLDLTKQVSAETLTLDDINFPSKPRLVINERSGFFENLLSEFGF